MTFKDFIATRRFVASVSAELGAESEGGDPGWIYAELYFMLELPDERFRIIFPVTGPFDGSMIEALEAVLYGCFLYDEGKDSGNVRIGVGTP